MLDDCPRCQRPLTGDGQLRYCDRCAYEPPESAALPVTPPAGDGGDDEVPALPVRPAKGVAVTMKGDQ